MAKEIKRIQVIFNLVDPHQKEIYDYIMKSTNYSGTAKSLIDVGYIMKNEKNLKVSIKSENQEVELPNFQHYESEKVDKKFSTEDTFDFSGYAM
ncbi:hypothetical protein [Gottfriedia solisilvae]|uniref:Uncharacterized protein n=1 Tax=Gottfriedia solisilvae TaxID=1516104 RepID=A0A8J3F5L2_9BACI|nr:hypothetical protein [Gottfriedia solisilvae]GGI18021.1 hypothetical protein GCM10007380_40850 [Gottfriedia solisilvae]